MLLIVTASGRLELAVGNSPSLPGFISLSTLSLSLLGGCVPVWRSRLIDSYICVGVITAWLIGREERWDIVITDTTLTHADGTSGSPLHREE